ncbi:hypothetical protein K438DRAFT_1688072 [Mycena galopus ATCC 62051]|nr:hypothetical protein K438DRAFT_1688072 [Mycena galopus ATCC 62051]
MGVPGLWKELAPVAKVRSLTELAVVEGFEANPNGTRGFRVGIDASIWFFHAAYGKEGENPELRTLFFRCATLMRAPFLPLFVFDGPLRPKVKRGKTIHRGLHKLAPGMKQIVEAFGFECRTAPGEAEAELAYLNRIGVLDGILSDDVDNFLFGATTVIRNASNNLSGNRANPVLNSDGRDDKNHTRVYRMQDITEHPDVSFTRGDMIFLALCSGGDYDTSGMTGCGPNIAKGLVRYGFGRSLYEAATNLSRDALKEFLHNWRNEMRHELRTDSQGYIGSKRRALASSLPDAFPDIDIILSYTNPLTSERVGRASEPLTWSKEPDLAKLATTCEFYFEWGYRDAIIKRFKTVIWHGAVLRILRRGVLDLEENRRRGGLVPSTPTRNGKPGAEGTPSKLITKHFSSMTLNPVEDDDDDRLITRITGQREHAFTDGILEYRLEIRPRQLVLLAESELGKHKRAPLDADPWAGLTESGNEGGSEAEELTAEERRAREEKEVRVWMPASMVRMAEPRLVKEFEQREEAKRLKKANKGTKRSPAKRKPKAQGSDNELSDAPKAKPPPKKTVRKAKPPAAREEEEESETISPKKTARKAKSTAIRPEETVPSKNTPKAFPALQPLDSDASSDDELPTFKLLHTKAPVKGKKTAVLPPVDPPARVVKDLAKAKGSVAAAGIPSADPFEIDPPPRVVRDLTKGKGKAVASGVQTDLKNFFPLTKAIGRKNNAQTLSAPLAPPAKPATNVAREHSTLSAPTSSRQVADERPSPSRGNPRDLGSDDVRCPPAPSKIQELEKADVENARLASKFLPRPFPLSFEDRPLPRRRSSITSSDSGSPHPRITKSPRKSAKHTSPREKSSAARAPSPTPCRRLESPPRNIAIIDISSDSDSPPPTPKLKHRRPDTKTATTSIPKTVLRPTNFPTQSRDVIDLSDI